MVEGEFLRVAQSCMNHLKIGAIGVKAEYGTLIGVGEFETFPRRDIHGTISDGSVESPVRAKGETVEIVSGEGNPDTESGEELFTLVRDSVIIGITKRPDVRNTGEIDLSFQSVDPGCRAIEHVIEPFSINAALVGLSVAIGIGEETDLLGLSGHFGDGILFVPFLVHRPSVFHREG